MSSLKAVYLSNTELLIGGLCYCRLVFVNDDEVVVTYGVELSLCIAGNGSTRDAFHPKAYASESVVVVSAIDSSVVVLAKETCAFLPIRHAIILEGCGACSILGNKHYAHAAYPLSVTV